MIYSFIQENTENTYKSYENFSFKQKQSESKLWNGYDITRYKLARGWLILAPSEDKTRDHFQSISKSKEPIVYLTDSNNSLSRYYFTPVEKLPQYIQNENILRKYFHCEAGSTVGDIVAAYEKESGESVFIGEVYLPCVYEPTGCPAFQKLKSDVSRDYIANLCHDDLYWETNTCNAFTAENAFLVSVLLPKYEVSSKIKFADCLEELTLLPPDKNKGFPGGTLYKEAKERFNSYKTKNTDSVSTNSSNTVHSLERPLNDIQDSAPTPKKKN